MHSTDHYLMAESQLTCDTVNIQHQAYLGDESAQYALADILQKGINVAKNSECAFYWYLRAAQQGNLAAQYNVWYAYFTGEGVGADTQEADKWFKRASLKNSKTVSSVIAELLHPTIQH